MIPATKEKLITGLFMAYVAVLAVGTVDQVFLDSMIFPPALDRQLLGMVDVLRTRELGSADDARGACGKVRERLAGIRLEQSPPPLESKLAEFAKGGTSLDEGRSLLEEARRQAVVNFVDNDEFSLRICIRALDPDLVMKLWVPGLSSDDASVKAGCLEALKQISGQKDGFHYDPRADRESQRMAIAQWKDWCRNFMEERRRPAPVAPLPQVSPTGEAVPPPIVPGGPGAPTPAPETKTP